MSDHKYNYINEKQEVVSSLTFSPLQGCNMQSVSTIMVSNRLLAEQKYKIADQFYSAQKSPVKIRNFIYIKLKVT